MDGQAEIRILSAGAPKVGVGRCAEAFGRRTGHRTKFYFSPAPAVREKLMSGRAEADLLVAPTPHMEGYVESGHVVAGSLVPVGAVRAGIAVRDGAMRPDISSVESLKAALLATDALLYNTASSGQYIEEMIEKLGLAEVLAGKTERFPTGADVMVRLAEGTAESEIAFGQITEIRRFTGGGTVLLGPLPEEVGKTTHYTAGLLAGAEAAGPARALLDFMATAEAQRIFADSGLE